MEAPESQIQKFPMQRSARGLTANGVFLCDLDFEKGKTRDMPTKSRSTSRRELISPRGSKRYIRRDRQGQFKKEVDVGPSLSADRRHDAKHNVPKGQGDRGDTT